MKPIKCKAWDEKSKSWVEYGFCLRFDAQGNCDILNPFGDKPLFPDRTPVLVFWTGLLDRNDKEIYEGDILLQRYSTGEPLYRYKAEIGENTHSIESFDLTYHGTHFTCLDISDVTSGMPYDYPVASDLEIIGNIYQNSELLKPQA